MGKLWQNLSKELKSSDFSPCKQKEKTAKGESNKVMFNIQFNGWTFKKNHLGELSNHNITEQVLKLKYIQITSFVISVFTGTQTLQPPFPLPHSLLEL